MKALVSIGLASVIALAAASPAQARQGCGRGFHRAYDGMCVHDRHHRGHVFVVGQFYPGRGYWYQNRWWRHRSGRHHHWRYY
ncbi:MAG: GCG_CRPN prefix-to-repeats domain-containing protein [Sphingomicrobium sp.]